MLVTLNFIKSFGAGASNSTLWRSLLKSKGVCVCKWMDTWKMPRSYLKHRFEKEQEKSTLTIR